MGPPAAGRGAAADGRPDGDVQLVPPGRRCGRRRRDRLGRAIRAGLGPAPPGLCQEAGITSAVASSLHAGPVEGLRRQDGMSAPSPTVLIVETSADEECPIEFLGDTADLVYFLSFPPRG